MRTSLAEIHRICDASWWGEPNSEMELARINAELDAHDVPTAMEILEAGFAKSISAARDPSRA